MTASSSGSTYSRSLHGLQVPPLENGDRLTRIEFEQRYNLMPHVKKAELVEGIVYMASPHWIAASHACECLRAYWLRRMFGVQIYRVYRHPVDANCMIVRGLERWAIEDSLLPTHVENANLRYHLERDLKWMPLSAISSNVLGRDRLDEGRQPKRYLQLKDVGQDLFLGHLEEEPVVQAWRVFERPLAHGEVLISNLQAVLYLPSYRRN